LGQIGEFALDFAKYHNMQHLVVYWQLSEWENNVNAEVCLLQYNTHIDVSQDQVDHHVLPPRTLHETR
jgi:hypothetical protein